MTVSLRRQSNCRRAASQFVARGVLTWSHNTSGVRLQGRGWASSRAGLRSGVCQGTTICERAGVTHLHFHDLRHEAGSRLLEAGWPLHHVQEMLGHADLKQTSTYLNVTQVGFQDSMRQFSTQLLHSVARDHESEHPATGNDQPVSPTHTTLN
jgi:site-specific recombinase XerD